MACVRKKIRKRKQYDHYVNDPWRRLANHIVMQCIYDIVYYDTSRSKIKLQKVSTQDRIDAELCIRQEGFTDIMYDLDGDYVADELLKHIRNGDIRNTNFIRKIN